MYIALAQTHVTKKHYNYSLNNCCFHISSNLSTFTKQIKTEREKGLVGRYYPLLYALLTKASASIIHHCFTVQTPSQT